MKRGNTDDPEVFGGPGPRNPVDRLPVFCYKHNVFGPITEQISEELIA